MILFSKLPALPPVIVCFPTELWKSLPLQAKKNWLMFTKAYCWGGGRRREYFFRFRFAWFWLFARRGPLHCCTFTCLTIFFGKFLCRQVWPTFLVAFGNLLIFCPTRWRNKIFMDISVTASRLLSIHFLVIPENSSLLWFQFLYLWTWTKPEAIRVVWNFHHVYCLHFYLWNRPNPLSPVPLSSYLCSSGQKIYKSCDIW